MGGCTREKGVGGGGGRQEEGGERRDNTVAVVVGKTIAVSCVNYTHTSSVQSLVSLPRSFSNSFNRAVASTLPIDSNASSTSSLSSVPCDSESKRRVNRRVSLWARTAWGRGGANLGVRGVWRWRGVARVRRACVCVHS